MFFCTAVYHLIWPSHIIQWSNLLKCNAGNANFGKVPKPSENLKEKIQKTLQRLTYCIYMHYAGNIYNSVYNEQVAGF